jgi:hypothetical protein
MSRAWRDPRGLLAERRAWSAAVSGGWDCHWPETPSGDSGLRSPCRVSFIYSGHCFVRFRSVGEGDTAVIECSPSYEYLRSVGSRYQDISRGVVVQHGRGEATSGNGSLQYLTDTRYLRYLLGGRCEEGAPEEDNNGQEPNPPLGGPLSTGQVATRVGTPGSGTNEERRARRAAGTEATYCKVLGEAA